MTSSSVSESQAPQGTHRRRNASSSNNSNKTNYMATIKPSWRSPRLRGHSTPSLWPLYRLIVLVTCSVLGLSWMCLLLRVSLQQRRTTTTTTKHATVHHAAANAATLHLRHHKPMPDAAHILHHANKTTAETNSGSSQSPDPDVVPSSEQPAHSRWFWIGIVRDAHQVQESTWEALRHVACPSPSTTTTTTPRGVVHHVHVVVGQDAAYAQQRIMRDKDSSSCAVQVEMEQDVGLNRTALPTNRVDRIAMIRNAQRQRVRPLWLQDRATLDNSDASQDMVVVMDLDLFRLPPVAQVIAQGESMASSHQPLDVVCAAGVTMASQKELWYYDTYATVLWPDTYVHPLKRRLLKEYFPGENASLVRSDNQHGSFTQGDLMRYLQQQAAATGTVRVRSCFGGLSIYRATTFFAESCSYSRQAHQPSLDRYASSADGRPCEHVVFQTCLQDTEGIPSAKIAINPKLLTLWRKD